MINAYVNARWVSEIGRYDPEWLGDPRFLAGVLVFVVGFAINNHSDNILLGLRKPGETGYSIPRGGVFRYVSCPNYFGELLEWAGWALATWSLAGLAFFVYTAAKPRPESAQPPRMVQGALRRLSRRPQGRDPRTALKLTCGQHESMLVTCPRCCRSATCPMTFTAG